MLSAVVSPWFLLLTGLVGVSQWLDVSVGPCTASIVFGGTAVCALRRTRRRHPPGRARLPAGERQPGRAASSDQPQEIAYPNADARVGRDEAGGVREGGEDDTSVANGLAVQQADDGDDDYGPDQPGGDRHPDV